MLTPRWLAMRWIVAFIGQVKPTVTSVATPVRLSIFQNRSASNR
jgi:hypothetical protein